MKNLDILDKKQFKSHTAYYWNTHKSYLQMRCQLKDLHDLNGYLKIAQQT